MDDSRRRFLAAASTATAFGLAGCLASGSRPDDDLRHDPTAWSGYDPDWTAPSTAPAMDVVAEDVLTGLKVPWDVTFAPDGTLFVTERVGRIRRFDGDELSTVTEPADAIDVSAVDDEPHDTPYYERWWVAGGEGGTLGVAVHPEYPDPGWLYVYYTATDGGDWENRVARYDATADDPASTHEILVDGIPADKVHNGGRLAFGPDNYLWITTGDAGNGPDAQDPQSLAGKVLRVQATGAPAEDNPRKDGWDDRVYTLGHRNPQCITWLPDATPVLTEHGTSGLDEVNVLEAGGNYGWPEVRKPAAYRGRPEFDRPVLSTAFEDSWAPTGGTFYTGDAVPEWQNRLVFGQLIAQRVGVASLTPDDQERPPAAGGERFDADWLADDYDATAWHTLRSLGRVRCVAEGPDGELYATTSNRDGRAREGFPKEGDDRLVRICPAE
ncbi:PQQ-dependent sugar dehydrogenase [Halobacterium litoreum]|uniref:PQQ-dependent sugar dehydrogenase n=1 Tax=Halobacterium litoreum TaxID=2039234 RepID=A0ABD5NFR9_9EURY|nr:PQQ-dependent sugar dehydrogenase [Halobacterium litoreum]UHH12983.1 PQQ-dependent sugar dehydrogenase [Halobacterium litoreum]